MTGIASTAARSSEMLAGRHYAGTTLTDEMLDEVWKYGHGTARSSDHRRLISDEQREEALRQFFQHLKNDCNFDMVRLGVDWSRFQTTEPGTAGHGSDTTQVQYRKELQQTLVAAKEAGVSICLGVGAKSASDAGQFRDIPEWAQKDHQEAFGKGGERVWGGQGDAEFNQDVLAFDKDVMDFVEALPEDVEQNITGYQVENEPLDLMDPTIGHVDLELLKQEAELVRKEDEHDRPVMTNMWSTQDHRQYGDYASNPDQSVYDAAEIVDEIGWDVYGGGEYTDDQKQTHQWTQTNEVAFALPEKFKDGIQRADGSKTATMIAELQASRWGAYADSKDEVQRLVDGAATLGMDVLFWRQEDLEGLIPNPAQADILAMEQLYGQQQRARTSLELLSRLIATRTQAGVARSA